MWVGERVYSQEDRQVGQVVELQTVWGSKTCHVWLPAETRVVRLPTSQLQPLTAAAAGTGDGVRYVAAAARVADAMTQPDMLLAPTMKRFQDPLCLPHGLASSRITVAQPDVSSLFLRSGLTLQPRAFRGASDLGSSESWMRKESLTGRLGCHCRAGKFFSVSEILNSIV